MADPSLDLQLAIVHRLKNTAGVTALVGQRVYDRPPTKAPPPVLPYVTYGSDQVLQDDVSCITAYEVAVQIDVWSQVPGQVQMKRIVGEVRAALHAAEFDLTDPHALVLIEHESTRYLDDPDGITSHGAVGFRALIDVAE